MADSNFIPKPFWPDRAWWLALLLVLVCAGVLRYTGYDFSLPYIENPDEARLNNLAQDIVSTGKIAPEDTHASYPLGLIGLHFALLSWFHSPTALPSTILPAIRLLSVIIGLASVVLVALLVYRIATPLAALAASVLWAIMPEAINVSRTGAADNFVTFWLLLSVFLTFSGTQYHRNGWVLSGSAALILAALLSYQAVLLAPLLLLIPLSGLRTTVPEGRKAILRTLSDQVFVFTLFLIWLLWLSPLVVSIKMGRWSNAFGSLTLSALIQNLTIPVAESFHSPAWIIGLAGLVCLLWPGFRRKIWLFGLVAIFVFGVAWGTIIGAEYKPDIEHLLSIGALWVVICGIGLAGWSEALLWAMGRIAKSKHAWVANIIVIILVAAGGISQIVTAVAEARQHDLPDRRNDLAVWADTTLEGGSHIADPADDRVLNALFGGYQGSSMFPMVDTALVTDHPLEEWRSRQVMYAIAPYEVYQEMRATRVGQAYLEQMVLLKSYPPSVNYRDPGMVVFRLYPIQHKIYATLGSIHLIGYDLDRTELAPGATLAVRYYWQAKQPTAKAARVFNHLTPLDSVEPVAQIDGSPLVGLRRPTIYWNDPNETVVSQVFILVVGPDVAPGRYRLVTGFYDPDTGQRLLTPGGESFVVVTMIQVTGQ